MLAVETYASLTDPNAGYNQANGQALITGQAILPLMVCTSPPHASMGPQAGRLPSGQHPADPITANAWAASAGGRMAFVWDVLRRVADGLERPLILFVHDVEHTLCGSFERFDAFEDAFGAGKARAPQPQLPQAAAAAAAAAALRMELPLVVIGGCSLGESGTHITTPAR